MIILYGLADIAAALLLVAGITALTGDLRRHVRRRGRAGLAAPGSQPARYQLVAAAGPVSLTDAKIEALASAIMCTSCRSAGGYGDCTCTTGCGHLACTGGLSPEAAEFLRSLTMPPEGAGH